MARGPKVQLAKEIEAEIVEAFRTGESATDIGRRMAIPRFAVYRTLHRAGLRPDQNQRHGVVATRSFEEEQAIVAEYLADRTRSTTKTAKKLGIPYGTLRKLLLRHDVDVSYHTDPEIVAEVIRLGREGDLSQPDIARLTGIHQTRVSTIFKKHGIKARQKGINRRERHGSWKGGRFINESGYVRMLLDPADPLFSLMADGSGYVMEHRLVMARHLGRALLPEETVHHKNGTRADNRVKNLEVFISRHPPGQRATEQIEFALGILAVYRGTPLMDEARRELPCPVCGSTKET